MLLLATAGMVVVAPASGLAAQAAGAQQPAPAPAPATPSTVQGVTVTGQSAVSIQIDRRSYNVANDLRTSSGSLTDALRNVPSVDVDVQGNVRLRGDPSVTILVDGRPAPQFQGATRADALQALPANTVERIEVMTSPSAEFTSQGTGGVINIVTRQARGAGPTATVRGTFGTVGRAQASVNGGLNAGKLSITVDASFRHDPRSLSFETSSIASPPGGGTRYSLNENNTSGVSDVLNAGLRVEYQLDSRTRISGQARFLDQQLDNVGFVQTLTGPSPDTLALDYARTLRRTLDIEQTTFNTGLRRTFPGEQHELTLDYQRFDRQGPRDVTETTHLFRRSATTPAFERFVTDWPMEQDSFKVAYRRPLPNSGRLVVGYDRVRNDLDSDSVGLRGDSPATAVPDPRLFDSYRMNELQQSFYGTYQQAIGPDLTVLAGVRIETTDVHLRSPGLTSPLDIDRVRVNPSLNLSYRLDEKSKLTFGYSRRMERPFAIDYNPVAVYLDPVTFRQGDPNIRAPKTDSFETAFEHRRDGATYLATLYYRRNADSLTVAVRPLGDGVFVNYRVNAGATRSGGLELVADGRITSKLRYNISSNTYYAEMNSGPVGAGVRTGFVASGRANLNWTPTAADLFQVNAVAAGRLLLPQGYILPRFALNLGYRRKLTDRAFLTLTADDALGTFGRSKLVLDSASVTQRQTIRFSSRALLIGVSYAFGGPSGRPRAAPNLEYGGGAAP
jgi:outer membrane receptor protein involved in Fe transport